MHITKPNASAPVTNTAVLYLTDVFGINLTENRLYAVVLGPVLATNVLEVLTQSQAGRLLRQSGLLDDGP